MKNENGSSRGRRKRSFQDLERDVLRPGDTGWPLSLLILFSRAFSAHYTANPEINWLI
jgi:hypothetical protein